MDPERFRLAEALFHEASTLPATERAVFLDARCAGDVPLRREVESLLAAACPGFLETPVPSRVEAAARDRMIGSTIGRYRLIGFIGEGGMGSVYLGERADGAFEQRVAVKLLRGDGREMLRRFERERELLARLEHPGVARLIDGGCVTDGRAYLVMEHVDGEPIDQYCERTGLDLRERLELLLQVCEAVAFTHRNLVIHRDIKPGNILVDAEGRARVIDFGVALPTGGQAGIGPRTTVGTVVGTVAYMSPEQLDGVHASELDTRTDIYSLGVVLYELLTGVPPHDVADASLGGAARRIIEQEPPRPSTLEPRLRGDAETILLKALEKDPSRRYQSAGELGDDIRRFLEARPILARPASPAYLARKFLERHRSQLLSATTSSAAVVLLAILLVVWFVVLPDWTRRSLRTARLEVLGWHAQESLYSAVFWRSSSAGQDASGFAAIERALREYKDADRFGMLPDDGRGELEAVSAARELFYVPRDRWGDSLPNSLSERVRVLVLDEDRPVDFETATAETLRDAGILLMLTNQYQRAVEVLREYETRVADDPFVEGLLGELYLALEKPALAYPRVRAAYDTYPDSRMITLSLAEAAIGVGDLARAELLLKKAADLPNPDQLDRIARVRAMYLAAAGRSEEARTAYRYATALTTRDGFHFNQNPVALYHRARFAAEEERILNAVQFTLIGLAADLRTDDLSDSPSVMLELFVSLLREEVSRWDDDTLRRHLEFWLETESPAWIVGSMATGYRPSFIPVSLRGWLIVYLRAREALVASPKRIFLSEEEQAAFKEERASWSSPDALTELARVMDVQNDALWDQLPGIAEELRDELIDAWVARDHQRATLIAARLAR